MTKIVREDLLKALSVAKPALAVKDLVPELTNFWFDGEHVMAFNDIIGIEVPCDSEFKGGVRGQLLLGFLEHTRAKELDFGVDADGDAHSLHLKAGASKMKLAMMALKRRMFDFPEVKTIKGLVVGDDFCEALKRALSCVGQDTSIADQLGVTVIANGAGCLLYSTDSKTIVQDSAKLKWGDRRVLPAVFCEQLLRLRGKDGGDLYQMPQAVLFIAKSGVRLYSRYVEVKRGLDFEGMITHLMPKDIGKKAIPLPSRLALALERALILLATMPGDYMTMRFNDDRLEIEVLVEGAGELKDTVALEKDHGAIERKLDPALIKRNLALCTKMYLGPDAFILMGDGGFTYLVSASQV